MKGGAAPEPSASQPAVNGAAPLDFLVSSSLSEMDDENDEEEEEEEEEVADEADDIDEVMAEAAEASATPGGGAPVNARPSRVSAAMPASSTNARGARSFCKARKGKQPQGGVGCR